MNQLDYQSAFTPGSLQHNQALTPASYSSFQQNNAQQTFSGAQQFHQGQQIGAQNGMYNVSPGQGSGPYTSAPQNRPVVATAQLADIRQSASPQQPNSPFAQQPQQSVKYPMAAPPLPQTPSSAAQFSPMSASAPVTPQSPGSTHQEPERVQMLLEINAELFEEVNSLQSQGKGGAVNPKQAEELKANGMDASMASEEYINALRRIQANLSYLASKGTVTGQSNTPLPGPAHMTPPPHMPQLHSKYDRLRELFPGWPGLDGRNANTARPTNQASTNGTTA